MSPLEKLAAETDKAVNDKVHNQVTDVLIALDETLINLANKGIRAYDVCSVPAGAYTMKGFLVFRRPVLTGLYERLLFACLQRLGYEPQVEARKRQVLAPSGLITLNDVFITIRW